MLEYIVYRTEHTGADGAADSATPEEAMQRHLSWASFIESIAILLHQ